MDPAADQASLDLLGYLGHLDHPEDQVLLAFLGVSAPLERQEPMADQDRVVLMGSRANKDRQETAASQELLVPRACEDSAALVVRLAEAGSREPQVDGVRLVPPVPQDLRVTQGPASSLFRTIYRRIRTAWMN